MWPIRDASQLRRACKVCGKESSYLFSMRNEHGEPGVLDIFSCSYCGLLFVGNALLDHQLAFAYQTLDSVTYYSNIATNTATKVSRALHDLESILAGSRNAVSVLDVGCGYGQFLQALARSHPSVRAVGQELPGQCASACEAKGLNVSTCPLEAISDRFRIVVLLDVIEHVADPNGMLRECYSLLERNGFVYIHTPRRCFWDTLFMVLITLPGVRRLSKAWLRTRVSVFHLHLWTDKALRLSLDGAGFEIKRLKSEMALSWPVEEYVRVYLGEKLGLASPVLRVVSGLAQVLFVRLRTLRNKAICLAQKKQ